MSQQFFHKPENALKRANELINVGNKNMALQLLHDMLTTRKSRAWQKPFETIALKYLDLCVELQQHRHAKDGLHQYRNMSQQQAPGSLEVVVTSLLDKSEAAAKKAAAQASRAAEAAAARVADLDNEATPESIMRASAADDEFGAIARERADRAKLVPALRFLWETYRAVLDILRTNSKLEHVYYASAVRAFEVRSLGKGEPRSGTRSSSSFSSSAA